MARWALPKGFKVSGIHCGIKRFNKDLGLIYSQKVCKSAGMFTKNKVKAAPVILTKEILSKNENIHAVIINSGNANACTGRYGIKDAKKTAQYVESALKVPHNTVCVASTGVIGHRLPIDKIISGVPKAVRNLSSGGLMSLAKAILTTDKKRKVETEKFLVGKKEVTVTGLCKGAGMIHPNMATMLCFIMTDADIDKNALKSALRECVEDSFNIISVDGDMSTNDTILIMANGEADNSAIRKGTKEYKLFKNALLKVCLELAKEIVRDGEGATKLITVRVENAAKEKEAEMIARKISNSALVKTSVHGQDPNWGRVASSVGSSMLESVKQNKIEIYLDGVCMFKKNKFTNPPANKLAGIYKKNNVDIRVNLNAGNKSAKMFTCDLSKRYVEINAHYLT